jgi:holo-[acyl-carrier protein] synthase
MKMMITMTKHKETLIKGIGNDIIEIDRIEKSIKSYGERFLNRIFTKKEIAYCKKNAMEARHFAGRFAAKESIAKALGCGIGKLLSWKDLEILNDENGKPSVILNPKRAQYFNEPNLHISISHCKSYATAIAIWT